MQADPMSQPPAAADCAAQRELADRWRAGVLDPRGRQDFERAMAADPRLAEHARYGRRLARSLQYLPRLAAHAGSRPAPRRALHWPRVLAAGMVSAGLAGLSFGLLPTLMQAHRPMVPTLQQIQTDPQLADALQNLDFYEWLAAHPRELDAGSSHGGTA